MIDFGRDVCTDLEAASKREWLEANGLGGFSSSTVAGLNTRRYHGLLTAATNPPAGRVLLLSKLEETLIIGGQRFDLSANQYPGVVHPRGHRYLKRFRLDPFPIFTYEIEGVEIDKAVFMIHGENSTVVQYGVRREGSRRDPLLLEVRPLIAYRDYHGTTHENDAIDAGLRMGPGIVTLAPYEGMPELHMSYGEGRVEKTGYWYRNIEYSAERERGLDFREDLFNPFALTFDMSGNMPAALIASTERRDVARAGEYRQAETYRRKTIEASAPGGGEMVRDLMAAADQYIVARGECKTVIAGYHWFGDWGRDTMIALPGLTLVTGRADIAKRILREFSLYVDRGMLPNRFADATETPEYNTIDATLWYFEAVRALVEYTGDYGFVRENLYRVLTDIIGWHMRGTRYGIRMDEDGLLTGGEEGAQLTWMDAKVGDWVVTPRRGKAVEIQALWYNALRVMERLAVEFGDEATAKICGQTAQRARRSFNESFWNEEAGCLYDVVDGGARDGAIRPNQILAVSLRHGMLKRERARRVLDVVERKLLTPFGLRSLAPDQAGYVGRYEGGVWERDGAYHQGTVWAWLMGPYITAVVRVSGGTRKSRRRASELLAAFAGHMRDAGLGQVSEIFDGDEPHLPRGCIAQAWSIAELLRAAVEDVYNLEPARRKVAAV